MWDMSQKNAERVHERPEAIHATLLLIALVLSLSSCETAASGAARKRTVSDSGKAALSGKTWLLAGYAFANQYIPLEPGHGSTALVVFGADGTLSGSTGTNTFSGTWSLGKASAQGSRAFTATILRLTKKSAPNETAARFEADFIRELGSAKALKTGKDSFRLLDARNGILLSFIFSPAESQY